MASGNQLVEVAREMRPGGVLIDGENLARAIEDTAQALKSKKRPIYEETFAHQDVLVRADLLLPLRGGYKLVEVKPSSGVKPYHVEDAAIQVWVNRNASLNIKRDGLGSRRANVAPRRLPVHSRPTQALVRLAHHFQGQ
jgi:hypothetical protein